MRCNLSDLHDCATRLDRLAGGAGQLDALADVAIQVGRLTFEQDEAAIIELKAMCTLHVNGDARRLHDTSKRRHRAANRAAGR